MVEAFLDGMMVHFLVNVMHGHSADEEGLVL